MKLIKAILAMLMTIVSCSEYCCDGAVEVQVCGSLQDELTVIKKAAERNNCKGDDFLLLLAIRKAENGRSGLEFGVKHRLCAAAIEREPERSLDIQAGWAAATISKNRRRWELAGRPGDFIDFLADRYCPPSVDLEGNKNWKRNVKYFFDKFNR